MKILDNPFDEKLIGLEHNPYHKALEDAAGKLANEVEKFLQTYTPPPGGGPVVGDETKPICRTLEITQEAPITGPHADAVSAAQRKALVDALHRAVALYLSPEARKRQEAQLQERIYNTPERFAKIEGKPITEKDDNGVYRATMRTSVFLTDPKEGNCRALPSMLKEMGLNPHIKGRVAVVIPEAHLQRPRVPDPAVETAIELKLQEAGFELADSQRVMKLREMDWHTLMAQGALPPSELERFRSDLGTDVEYLISGEAFSQRLEVIDLATALATALRYRSARRALKLRSRGLPTAQRYILTLSLMCRRPARRKRLRARRRWKRQGACGFQSHQSVHQQPSRMDGWLGCSSWR